MTPSGPPLGGDREIVYRRRRSWFRRHLSRIVPIVVVLVVIAGIVTAVFAIRNIGAASPGELAESVSVSDPPLPSSVAPTPSATASTTPPAAGSTQTTATGTVIAVLKPGSWTVSVQAGLDLTVVTTNATTYEHDKQAADVEEDSRITVVGTMADGIITATSVTIEKKAPAT